MHWPPPLASPTLRIVSDGQTVWTWRGDLDQYTMPPGTHSITFQRFELAAPDPSLFTWTPPRGARQVDRFQQSRVPNGPNPQPW